MSLCGSLPRALVHHPRHTERRRALPRPARGGAGIASEHSAPSGRGRGCGAQPHAASTGTEFRRAPGDAAVGSAARTRRRAQAEHVCVAAGPGADGCADGRDSPRYRTRRGRQEPAPPTPPAGHGGRRGRGGRRRQGALPRPQTSRQSQVGEGDAEDDAEATPPGGRRRGGRGRGTEW